MQRLKYTLICPFDKSIISKYKGFDIVIRTGEKDEINRIDKEMPRNSRLCCIILETDNFVTDISYDWKDIPVALYVKGIGSVSSLTEKLPEISKTNVRFYLKGRENNVYRDSRILSSLGLSTAIVIGENPNFEFLKDLMAYSCYSTIDRPLIEPFSYLAKNYTGKGIVDYRTVYFENPLRFLHIDEKGRVFLSKKDFSDGLCVTDGDCCPEKIRSTPLFKERLAKWHETFLKPDGCAYCEVYKLCGGIFEYISKDHACRDFFIDLLGGIEFIQKKKNRVKKAVWQL